MNPIFELKKIINSLNHSVNDFDIQAFDSIIMDIWQSYKQIPAVGNLLKMIRSLVLYLISKQSTAHMDTLPILNNITSQLEKIVTTPPLEKNKINKIASDQLREYKLFQNKLHSNPDIDIQDMDEIKAVILAIDWEISEKTLRNFDTVVTQLLNKLKAYKIHHTFLKMIHSIGRFIGIQKANAPTDSISFLRSLFEHLQDIIQKKEMSFDEKKKILEKDISRFNDFKIRISKSRKKPTIATDESISGNDGILPALSHIKSSKIKPSQDQMSLTRLPEAEDSVRDDTIGSENIKPALINKHTPSRTPKDVMDDLFSIKESPADELLDAIHLMEIQGNADPSNQTMRMFDQEEDIQSDGVKKFITQKKDTTPIAEIDSRLDEFFNLETSADSYSEEPVENMTSKMEEDSVSDDMAESLETADFIVPFKDADEAYEESGPSATNLKLADDLSEDEILKRIEIAIKEEAWLTEKDGLDLIYKDILFLKTAWQKDFHKTCLLEIILHNISMLTDMGSEKMISENSNAQKSYPDSDFNPPLKSSSSFLGKLKSIFTS